MLSPDDHRDIANAFSESCRLESMPSEQMGSAQVQQQQKQQSSIGNSTHHNFYGMAAMHSVSQSQTQSNIMRPILHLNHGISPSSSSSSSISSLNSAQSPSGSNQTQLPDKRNDINMHQKLQRQLSLNPYDPRMIRMHNTNSLQTKHSMSEQRPGDMPQQMMHQRPGHRQLAPSLSGGPHSHNMTNHWDLHQVRYSLLKLPDSILC